MFSDRLAKLRTKADADALLGEIDAYRDSLYVYPAIKTKEKVQIPPELDKLEETVKKLELVKLTLAYEPSPEDIEAFFKAAGKILDISKDLRILGGAVVSYQGKYGDFSVRKKLVNSQFSNTNLQINH